MSNTKIRSLLSDAKVRGLRPRGTLYRVADSHGLCIEITPTGSKLWRYRYRFSGKPTMLSLGEYPLISLAEARERHTNARRLLESGKDPAAVRRAEKRRNSESARNSFQVIAREWARKQAGTWTAHHSADVWRSLEHEAFPVFGDRPIEEIDAPEILRCLKAIESRGALEVARRTAQRIASVFRYAVLTGRARYNPAADLRGAIAARKPQHMAAMPEEDLPEFLRSLQAYDGRAETAWALRLLVLTFVRTSELLGARWEEIDIDQAEWRIPAARMKMRQPHIVPLSRQALEVLPELQRFSGHSPMLFPARSNLNRSMSNNTMLFALYRMGYHTRATVHGFRALASTILNEQGWPPDVIERQLAHAERNKVRAAYNRAEYLGERRRMMQAWADYLDGVRAGAAVIPFKRTA